MYRTFDKRLLDLALTIPALILLSPVLGLVALLVRLKLGAPILFRQQRPGLNGQPFTLLKFRTMTNVADERDAEGNLLPAEDRLTPFSRVDNCVPLATDISPLPLCNCTQTRALQPSCRT